MPPMLYRTVNLKTTSVWFWAGFIAVLLLLPCCMGCGCTGNPEEADRDSEIPCTVGDTKCQDRTVLLCDPTLGWKAHATCREDQICQDGACVESEREADKDTVDRAEIEPEQDEEWGPEVVEIPLAATDQQGEFRIGAAGGRDLICKWRSKSAAVGGAKVQH
jgi:hypothetical protein